MGRGAPILDQKRCIIRNAMLAIGLAWAEQASRARVNHLVVADASDRPFKPWAS
jgi:hypothetical protein